MVTLRKYLEENLKGKYFKGRRSSGDIEIYQIRRLFYSEARYSVGGAIGTSELMNPESVRAKINILYPIRQKEEVDLEYLLEDREISKKELDKLRKKNNSKKK